VQAPALLADHTEAGPQRTRIDAEDDHARILQRRPPVTAAVAALIVVAAGTGSRLGAGVRKAFVDFGGRPLLVTTLQRLAVRGDLAPVVVVVHREDLAAARQAVADLPRAVQVVPGGERRQDSVLAGLTALAALGTPLPGLVAVHDAARPFVPLAALDELLACAARDGAALLAVPVVDTLKREDTASSGGAGLPSGRIGGSVPREHLLAAQTPQVFRRETLAALLATARDEGRSVTDECTLFEAAGLAVGFVQGSPRNFKITTAEDLALARAVLALEAQEGSPR